MSTPVKAKKKFKKGKNRGRNVKWESKRNLKNKNQYQLPVAELPPLTLLIS